MKNRQRGVVQKVCPHPQSLTTSHGPDIYRGSYKLHEQLQGFNIRDAHNSHEYEDSINNQRIRSSRSQANAIRLRLQYLDRCCLYFSSNLSHNDLRRDWSQASGVRIDYVVYIYISAGYFLCMKTQHGSQDRGEHFRHLLSYIHVDRFCITTPVADNWMLVGAV